MYSRFAIVAIVILVSACSIAGKPGSETETDLTAAHTRQFQTYEFTPQDKKKGANADRDAARAAAMGADMASVESTLLDGTPDFSEWCSGAKAFGMAIEGEVRFNIEILDNQQLLDEMARLLGQKFLELGKLDSEKFVFGVNHRVVLCKAHEDGALTALLTDDGKWYRAARAEAIKESEGEFRLRLLHRKRISEDTFRELLRDHPQIAELVTPGDYYETAAFTGDVPLTGPKEGSHSVMFTLPPETKNPFVELVLSNPKAIGGIVTTKTDYFDGLLAAALPRESPQTQPTAQEPSVVSPVSSEAGMDDPNNEICVGEPTPASCKLSKNPNAEQRPSSSHRAAQTPVRESAGSKPKPIPVTAAPKPQVIPTLPSEFLASIPGDDPYNRPEVSWEALVQTCKQQSYDMIGVAPFSGWSAPVTEEGYKHTKIGVGAALALFKVGWFKTEPKLPKVSSYAIAFCLGMSKPAVSPAPIIGAICVERGETWESCTYVKNKAKPIWFALASNLIRKGGSTQEVNLTIKKRFKKDSLDEHALWHYGNDGHESYRQETTINGEILWGDILSSEAEKERCGDLFSSREVRHFEFRGHVDNAYPGERLAESGVWRTSLQAANPKWEIPNGTPSSFGNPPAGCIAPLADEHVVPPQIASGQTAR